MRIRAETTGQRVRPIFPTFVFFDWYNTLSTTQFWDSILGNERHPLSGRLNAALEDLFRGRTEFVGSRMRGQVTDEQVIETLNINLPRGYKADYLLRELLRDCRNAKINPAMAVELIAQRRCSVFAVVLDMRCESPLFSADWREFVQPLLSLTEFGLFRGDVLGDRGQLGA